MREDQITNDTEDTRLQELCANVASFAGTLRFCSFQLSLLFGVGAFLSGYVVHEHFTFHCDMPVCDGTEWDAIAEPLLSGTLPILLCLISTTLCFGFLLLAKRCKDLERQ